MKHLYEFAKFQELINKDNLEYVNKNIKKIDYEFDDNEKLVNVVNIPSFNKGVFLIWYNNEKHSMIKRIKDRTGFLNTSDFNEFITKGIINLFENHFDEIDNTGRYSIRFKENNFCLLLELNYDNLFQTYTKLYIITVVSTADDVYKEIIINDENF